MLGSYHSVVLTGYTLPGTAHHFTAPRGTATILFTPFSFSTFPIPLNCFTLAAMTSRHPESPEDFEFIQTPEAPVQTKPAFDCGVPTTLVSSSS